MAGSDLSALISGLGYGERRSCAVRTEQNYMFADTKSSLKCTAYKLYGKTHELHKAHIKNDIVCLRARHFFVFLLNTRIKIVRARVYFIIFFLLFLTFGFHL